MKFLLFKMYNNKKILFFIVCLITISLAICTTPVHVQYIQTTQMDPQMDPQMYATQMGPQMDTKQMLNSDSEAVSSKPNPVKKKEVVF